MTLTSVVTPQAVIVTLPRELLISPSRSLNNEFGRSFAFSPDGTVLVIGEPRASQGALGISAGSVHLFVKSNGKWGKAQSLASQPPIKSGDYFGYSVDVSKDGMTIAIGGLFSGKVDLYTKSGTGSWLFLQNLQADGTTAVRFGTSVSFHRSNALLAVGDYLANPNNVSNAGVVQLFKKSANKWVFSQQLTAKSQAASNFFGSDFIFSPDGNSLAVSESGGDLAAIDGGVVHLFVFNGIDWSFSQELTSSSAGTNFFFGGSTVRKKAIDFSFDSTTIAIGEGGSNTVQLFTLSAGTWNPGPVLSVTTATGGLGSSVSYSADGSTLAAGEPYATIDGVPNAGTVRLFRKNGVNWSANGIVSALVPTAGNYFGYTLLFSPVSNELAVFEYYGDTVNVKDAGVVSIIDISQLP